MMPADAQPIISPTSRALIGWYAPSRFDLCDYGKPTFDSFDEFGRLVGINIGRERATRAVVIAARVAPDMLPANMRA
jgi:hypothetical protein